MGGNDKKQILNDMKQKVPEYMLPNILRCVESLPLTKNGKTDRRLIRELYQNKRMRG